MKMDRKNCFLAVILLVLVFSNGSDAALLGKFRGLVGLESETKISPAAGPIPETGSDVSKVNKSTTNNNTQIPPINNPTEVDHHPKGSGSNETKKSQYEVIDKEKEGIGEKCDEAAASASKRCLNHDMIACLRLERRRPDNKQAGLQDFSLLLQNIGESNLEVNITVVPASVTMDLKQLQIPKLRSRKVNFVVNVGGSSKVTVTAGSGECVLHTWSSIPQARGNFFPSFPQIPSYTTLLRPIYGAYFLFVIALIVGGSWACCKFGKRRQQHGSSGVPYQELEMGSSSAVKVETADGWDQSWDDDWDEEKAVRSPGGQRAGNLSANGLTSRSSSKDDWGNDWDD